VELLKGNQKNLIIEVDKEIDPNLKYNMQRLKEIVTKIIKDL